jgi:hypothetical protein
MTAQETVQTLRRAAITLAKGVERRKAKFEAMKQRKKALEFLTKWEEVYPELRQHPAFEAAFDAIDDAKDYFADGDK